MAARSVGLLLMQLISTLLLCGIIAQTSDTYSSYQKIAIAMDRQERLNPVADLKNAPRLFEMRYIENPGDFSTKFDLVVFANWSRVHEMYKESKVKVPAFIDNDVSLMELFENKAKWKAWMCEMGLGDLVSLTYNQNAFIGANDFPGMLNTNQHIGNGMHISANKQQLDSVIAGVSKEDKSFSLEEALAGAELTELTAYGSTFRGKLISLRCTSRSFDATAAKKSAHLATSVSDTSHAGVIVRGQQMESSQEHYMPCSQELVGVLTTMFSKSATYTGPFCANIKFDKNLRPKIMEINARICESLYENDFLFTATFVPLAFAFHEYTKDIPNFHRSAFDQGGNQRELLQIVGDERYALETGGGLYQGSWLTCEKFDASLRLDDPRNMAARKLAQANNTRQSSSQVQPHSHSNSKSQSKPHKHDSHHYKPSSDKSLSGVSKITFGVDLHEGLNPGPWLHSAQGLFEYRILTQPADLTADIDIITHANYTALMGLVTAANGTTLPGYIANKQATLDTFNDKGRWKAWMAQIGLGAYVPHTYDQSKDVNTYDYPLMLKTNQHFGHGVYVINSAEHLQNVSTNVKQRGYNYTLEEALTGMGLSEVGTYGAAYKGQLLSLRCVIRTFSKDQTVRTGDPTKSKTKMGGAQRSSTNTTADVFVRGFMMKSGEEAAVPCSTEITQVTRKMLAKTSYTGAFCSSLKSDKQSRPKMLEINARFCGPMAVTGALFIATFVPLSVAHYLDQAATRRKVAPNAKHPKEDAGSWYQSSRIYAHIVEVEKKVLDSGGGMVKGKMITVKRFDPSLRVLQIGYDPIDGFRVPHFYHHNKPSRTV